MYKRACVALHSSASVTDSLSRSLLLHVLAFPQDDSLPHDLLQPVKLVQTNHGRHVNQSREAGLPGRRHRVASGLSGAHQQLDWCAALFQAVGATLPSCLLSQRLYELFIMYLSRARAMLSMTCQ